METGASLGKVKKSRDEVELQLKEALNREIHTQRRLQGSLAEVTALKEKNGDLSMALEGSAKRAEALQVKLNTAVESCVESEKKADVQIANVQRLEDEVNDRKKREEAFEMNLRAAEVKWKKTKSELESTMKVKEDLSQEVEGRQMELEKMKAESQQEADKRDQAVASVSFLQKELEQVKTELKKAKDVRETLTGQLDEKEELFESLSAENQRFKERKQLLEGSLVALEAKIACANEEAEKRQLAILELEKKLVVAEERLAERTKEVEELTSRAQRSAREKEAAEMELQVVKKQVEALQVKLEEAEAVASTGEGLISSSDWAVQEVAKQLESSKKLVAEKGKEISTLLEQIVCLQHELERTEARRERGVARLESSRTKLMLAEEDIKKLNGEIENRDLKLSRASEEKESLESRYNDILDEMDQLNLRLEAAERTVAEKETRNENLQLAFTKVRNQEMDKDLLPAVQELEKELERERVFGLEMKEKAESFERKLSVLKKELDDEKSSGLSMRNKADNLEKQLDAIQEMEKELESQRVVELPEGYVKGEASKCLRLQGEIAGLTAEIVSLEKEIAASSAQVESMNGELDKANKSAEVANSELLTLSKCLDEKTMEADTLVREIETLKTEMLSKEESLKQELLQYQQAAENEQMQKMTAEERLDAVKTELSATKLEMEKVKFEAKSMEGDLASIKALKAASALKDGEVRRALMEKSQETARAEASAAELIVVQRSLERLTEKLSEKTDEVTVLNVKLREMEVGLDTTTDWDTSRKRFSGAHTAGNVRDVDTERVKVDLKQSKDKLAQTERLLAEAERAVADLQKETLSLKKSQEKKKEATQEESHFDFEQELAKFNSGDKDVVAKRVRELLQQIKRLMEEGKKKDDERASLELKVKKLENTVERWRGFEQTARKEARSCRQEIELNGKLLADARSDNERRVRKDEAMARLVEKLKREATEAVDKSEKASKDAKYFEDEYLVVAGAHEGMQSQVTCLQEKLLHAEIELVKEKEIAIQEVTELRSKVERFEREESRTQEVKEEALRNWKTAVEEVKRLGGEVAEKTTAMAQLEESLAKAMESAQEQERLVGEIRKQKELILAKDERIESLEKQLSVVTENSEEASKELQQKRSEAINLKLELTDISGRQKDWNGKMEELRERVKEAERNEMAARGRLDRIWLEMEAVKSQKKAIEGELERASQRTFLPLGEVHANKVDSRFRDAMPRKGTALVRGAASPTSGDQSSQKERKAEAMTRSPGAGVSSSPTPRLRANGSFNLR